MTREKRKKINFSNIKKLYKYIYPHRVKFYIGIIFLLLNSLTVLIFPKLIGDLVKASQTSHYEINKIAIWLII